MSKNTIKNDRFELAIPESEYFKKVGDTWIFEFKAISLDLTQSIAPDDRKFIATVASGVFLIQARRHYGTEKNEVIECTADALSWLDWAGIEHSTRI